MPSTIKSLALIIGLPAIAATFSGYQSYQNQLEEWQLHNVANNVVEEVPFAYQMSDAPAYTELKSTFVQRIESQSVVQVEKPEMPVSITEPTKVTQSSQKPESTDFISKLDLSELAPELALKVESAIKDERVEPKSVRNAPNLSLQPEAWYDKLPAMNFQTHVYSSQVNKRWVKINGTEYSEGSWIGEVELVSIEPQSCLIRYQGELIEVPALYDWQG